MPIFTKSAKPLVVTKDQFARMDRERAEEALHRLNEHLKACFPDPMSQLDDAETRVFLAEGSRRAHGYGLKAEHEIQLYFHAMLTLGVGFEDDEKHEEIGKHLSDTDTPTAERLAHIVDKVQQALAARNPTA